MLCSGLFRFWDGDLTDHALIEIVDRITNGFMESKNIIGVFIDLLKAFDAVNKKKKIEKLEINDI